MARSGRGRNGAGSSGGARGSRAANEYKTLLSKDSDSEEEEETPSLRKKKQNADVPPSKKKRVLESESEDEQSPFKPVAENNAQSPKPADGDDDDDLDIPLSQRKSRSKPPPADEDEIPLSARKNLHRAVDSAAEGGIKATSSSVSRPRRAAAKKNKAWEKDYVIGSSDGELDAPDEQDEEWGEDNEGAAASSEEWEPDEDSDGGKASKVAKAEAQRQERAQSRQSRAAGNRYIVGGTVSREKSKSKASRGKAAASSSRSASKSRKRKAQSSEEEEEEAQEKEAEKANDTSTAELAESSEGARARPRRTASSRRERAAAALRRGGGLASVGKRKQGSGEEEEEEEEEEEDENEDAPLVTPKAQRAEERRESGGSRAEGRYVGGAGGSGGGSRSRGSGLSGVDIMGSKRGKQIVSSKQIVVCPICYRQMEKFIPDSERGQNFEHEALTADPLEVLLRKGGDKVCSFVFVGSKDFKQHYRMVHRSSRVPSDVSQFYLKQFVYNHLTKTTREANYSMLNTMKHRGVHDEAEEGDRPDLSLSSDSKMIAAYWGENDHHRAFRYNDILTTVLTGEGSHSPLFSEVEESEESASESDINDFIADDGEESESESESEEEDERDKKKRLAREKRKAERKEQKRQKRARDASDNDDDDDASEGEGRARRRRVMRDSDDDAAEAAPSSALAPGSRSSRQLAVEEEEEEEEDATEMEGVEANGVRASQLAEVDEWVQCDECCKWRRIPQTAKIDLDADFTCEMLPGMACSVPEEVAPEEGGANLAASETTEERGAEVKSVTNEMETRIATGGGEGAESDEEDFALRKPASTPRKGRKTVLDSEDEEACSSQQAVKNLDGGGTALDFDGETCQDENSQDAWRDVKPRRKVKQLAESDEEDEEEKDSMCQKKGRKASNAGETPPTTPSKYGFRTRHKKGYEKEEARDWKDELKQRNRNLLTGKVSTKSEEAVVEVLDSDEGSMEDFVVNDSGDEFGDDWQSRAAAMEAKKLSGTSSKVSAANGGHKEKKRGGEKEGEKKSKRDAKEVDGAVAAVQEGDVAKLRALLKESPTRARQRAQGRTLLHVAVESGSLPCVKELVRSGALVNARDDVAGTTPLLLALQQRQVDVFRWLLEHGADVMQADVEGTLPLHMAAAACSYADLSKLLGKMQAKDRRLGVNARDNRGQQAMHYAAAEGNKEVLKKLCTNHDVDANCRDSHDLTPLHVLAMSGHAEVLFCMCKELGADVREQDVDGMTALHHASHSGHAECVRKLIELGAWVDLELPVTTSLTPGATSLHLAAAGGHKECVKSLIESKARVEVRDKQNWTPLLYADFVQSRECVVALLQPENPEICATQLQHLGILLQGDRAETQDRVIKVIEYVATVPEFYDAINHYVARTPQVLDGAMKFLLSNKSLLSFPNKQAWFRQKMGETFETMISSHFSWGDDGCRMVVSRAQLALSSFAALMDLEMQHLRSPSFGVVFDGEEGVGTGPTREFFQSAPQAMLDPSTGIFELTEDGSAYHPKAGGTKGWGGWRIEAVGRLVGLALRNECVLNVRLSRTFMRLVLGEPLDLDHLQDVDAQLHRSLSYLIDTEGATESIEATFSVVEEEDEELPAEAASAPSEVTVIPDSDDEAAQRPAISSSQGSASTPSKKKRRVVELVKNGSKVEVTEKNKIEYVEKYATYKLVTAVKKTALKIFSEYDVELLLCGLPTIDVEAWRQSALYRGNTAQGPLSADSTLTYWFWDFVRSREEADKALLLKFCTGSAAVPANGFMHLPGLHSECQFTLSCVGPGDERLPTASTCFNHLKIPDYSTKAILEERLHVALHYGAEGFSFS